jgi:5,10-methenyltetrahydrofolate synthetase
MTKKLARILVKEKILNLENKSELEAKILANLKTISLESKKIISYRADQFEVNLDSLDENLNKFYYPKIISISEKKIQFVKPNSWKIGHFSIPEPIGEQVIEPNQADLIFVPALYFNEKGVRLGRGAGFYDRALEKVSSKKLIGFSFGESFSIDFSYIPTDISVQTVIFPNAIVNLESIHSDNI